MIWLLVLLFFACVGVALVVVLVATSQGGDDGAGAGAGGDAPNVRIPDRASVGRSTADFKSVNDSLVFPPNKAEEIKNITDVGNGVMQFVLRHRGSWYDGDRDLQNNQKGLDKSRAEVSGLSKEYQQVGETWEYGTSFKVASDFVPSMGYCNVMQQFPMSWVMLTRLKGDTITGGLYYTKGYDSFSPHESVRDFTFRRGEWVSLVVRLKLHDSDGECQLSVNGDEFRGVRGVRMANYRRTTSAHWGIYGSATKDVNGQALGDWTVWHKNIWMRKVS